MKKILLVVIMFMTIIQAQAQSFTYHPFKEFRGDTIAFLQKNFQEQSKYFVGKKFEVLLEQYIREMPLKDCDTWETSPYVDPQGNCYISGAWLQPMETYFLPKDTAKAVYTVDFDIDFQPPYTVLSDNFNQSLPEDISSYGIALRLRDYIIKEIRIQVYDRRRTY